MSVSVRHHRYSFQDYLSIEAVSTIRHEFLDGEIYAMAGGSVLHAALSAAVLASSHHQLEGRCRTYSSDLRVRVLATGLASYPDVTVVCGTPETDPENAETIVNPRVLVEVLSPATIDYDLGEKFEHYQRIPSLDAVVYVLAGQAPDRGRARQDGSWKSAAASAGGAALIDCIACRLDVDALYTDAGAGEQH